MHICAQPEQPSIQPQQQMFSIKAVKHLIDLSVCLLG